MKTKNRIAIAVSCITLAILLALGGFSILSGNNSVAGAASVFAYNGVKYSECETEYGRRGLRMYAYDGGATAEFRNVQSGTFRAELAFGSFDGRKDLKKFSLKFTDKASGKSFSVQISAYSDRYDAGVVYGDGKAGIVYLESDGKAYGLTAGYNAGGEYTRFTSDICSLTFEPDAMRVKVKADDGNYRVVWDLSNRYNDGKLLANDLSAFGKYTVSIVFDEVTANSRGDIMAYSFGGYSLGGENIEYAPSINVSDAIRPVVGEEYELPLAEVIAADGSDASDKIKTKVYDAEGNAVAENVKTFTPAAKGALYVYYYYEENGVTADYWHKTEAIEASEITSEFSRVELPEKVGAGAKIKIPAATVKSNLLSGGEENCLVTVKKDGAVNGDCENVAGEFYFTAETAGNYSVIYKGEKTGKYAERTVNFTADDGITAVNGTDDVPAEFAAGATYSFPTAEMRLGNNRASVAPVVIYPSGKRTDGSAALDETGKYTLVYEAEIGGAVRRHEKTFVVKSPYASGFDGGNATYASMRANEAACGVRLQLADNNTVSYGKTIDLSEYTFDESANTGKTLLEVSFDPSVAGTPDLDSFFVVLTDKYDPANYITIRLKYLIYSPICTFVRARASSQTVYVGYNYDFMTGARSVDNAATHEEGGFTCSGSFTNSMQGYDFDFLSLKLFFDYASKRLYARPIWLTGHGDWIDTKIPWLVYDFDDLGEAGGGNKPWTGFTTGEATLSMYAKGVSGTTDAFVLEVDGENMRNPLFDDRNAPVIVVDADEENIPEAKAGERYRVFGFTATDGDSAIVDSGVTVTNDSTGRTETIENGAFTPLEGTYTLTYYAVDAFGNRTEKKIKVTAKFNVDEPALEVADDMPTTANYGQTITLAGYEITNPGAGGATVDVKVTCGKTDIPIADGAFVCVGAEGTYTVAYTLTDYIGQSVSVRKRVRVTRVEAVIFDEDEIALPKAYMNGDIFSFDKYVGTYYNAALEKVEVPAVITVTDGGGTKTVGADGKYVPAASETVTNAEVNVVFASDGATRTVTRTVPINTAKNGENYMQNYFIYDNANVTATSGGLTFTNVTNDDMTFSFARPVYAKTMTLRFALGADKFNAEAFTATLTDKADGRNAVALTFVKRGGQWSLTIGGTTVTVIPDVDGYISLTYDDATRAFTDTVGGSVVGAKKNAAGKDFVGFTGGSAYIDCAVTGVTGVTEAGIRAINNQTVNSVRRDMQKPYVKIDGTFAGRVPVGTEVTMLPATAYDVLSALGEVTVGVRSGDTVIVKEHALAPGETFTISECGTYKITYKVTDAAGNSATDVAEFSVYDPIKPVLTFDGNIESTVKAGTTITLPGYVVSDDRKDEVDVRIYLMSPDGSRTRVTDGKVTVEKRGAYTIIYFATDPNGNSVMYRFAVVAE